MEQRKTSLVWSGETEEESVADQSSIDLAKMRRRSFAKRDASLQAELPLASEVSHLQEMHDRVRIFYSLVQHFMEDDDFPFVEEWLDDAHRETVAEKEIAAIEDTERQISEEFRKEVSHVISAADHEIPRWEKMQRLKDLAVGQRAIVIRRAARLRSLGDQLKHQKEEAFVAQNRLALESGEMERESAQLNSKMLIDSANALLGKLFLFLRGCVAKEIVPRPEDIVFDRPPHPNPTAEGRKTWPEDAADTLDLAARIHDAIAAMPVQVPQPATSSSRDPSPIRTPRRLSLDIRKTPSERLLVSPHRRSSLTPRRSPRMFDAASEEHHTMSRHLSVKTSFSGAQASGGSGGPVRHSQSMRDGSKAAKGRKSPVAQQPDVSLPQGLAPFVTLASPTPPPSNLQGPCASQRSQEIKERSTEVVADADQRSSTESSQSAESPLLAVPGAVEQAVNEVHQGAEEVEPPMDPTNQGPAQLDATQIPEQHQLLSDVPPDDIPTGITEFANPMPSEEHVPSSPLSLTQRTPKLRPMDPLELPPPPTSGSLQKSITMSDSFRTPFQVPKLTFVNEHSLSLGGNSELGGMPLPRWMKRESIDGISKEPPAIDSQQESSAERATQQVLSPMSDARQVHAAAESHSSTSAAASKSVSTSSSHPSSAASPPLDGSSIPNKQRALEQQDIFGSAEDGVKRVSAPETEIDADELPAKRKATIAPSESVQTSEKHSDKQIAQQHRETQPKEEPQPQTQPQQASPLRQAAAPPATSEPQNRKEDEVPQPDKPKPSSQTNQLTQSQTPAAAHPDQHSAACDASRKQSPTVRFPTTENVTTGSISDEKGANDSRLPLEVGEMRSDVKNWPPTQPPHPNKDAVPASVSEDGQAVQCQEDSSQSEQPPPESPSVITRVDPRQHRGFAVTQMEIGLPVKYYHESMIRRAREDGERALEEEESAKRVARRQVEVERVAYASSQVSGAQDEHKESVLQQHPGKTTHSDSAQNAINRKEVPTQSKAPAAASRQQRIVVDAFEAQWASADPDLEGLAVRATQVPAYGMQRRRKPPSPAQPRKLPVISQHAPRREQEQLVAKPDPQFSEEDSQNFQATVVASEQLMAHAMIRARALQAAEHRRDSATPTQKRELSLPLAIEPRPSSIKPFSLVATNQDENMHTAVSGMRAFASRTPLKRMHRRTIVRNEDDDAAFHTKRSLLPPLPAILDSNGTDYATISSNVGVGATIGYFPLRTRNWSGAKRYVSIRPESVPLLPPPPPHASRTLPDRPSSVSIEGESVTVQRRLDSRQDGLRARREFAYLRHA